MDCLLQILFLSLLIIVILQTHIQLVKKSIYSEQIIQLFAKSTIPHICHGRHGRQPCKFFLAGVNFYRFNAKNWRKLAFFGANFGVNGQKLAKNWQKLAFFGVNFILQKFCLCKKNDKYEECPRSP